MLRYSPGRLSLISSLVLVAGGVTVTAGQTPTSLSSTASFQTANGRSIKSVGSNNEWIIGTQLGAKLYGSGDISDNLLVSGLIRYDIPLKDAKEFGLPIFTNLGTIIDRISTEGSTKDSIDAAIGSLVSNASGVSIGLYPYRVLGQTLNGNLRITLFGQVVAKLNAFQGRASITAPDTAAKVEHRLLQGRSALGIEFGVGAGDTNYKPLTVSLTGVGTTTSGRTYELIFGERKSTILSFELTAVVPVRAGAGVLLEGIAVRDHRPAWRAGMIVAMGKETETPLTTAMRCMDEARAGVKPHATDNEVRASQGYKDCVGPSR